MNTARHFWQTRPSANKLGDAPWVHGRLQPMQIERPRGMDERPWWRRIGGRA